MSTETIQRDIDLLNRGQLPPLNNFRAKTTISEDGLIISTL